MRCVNLQGTVSVKSTVNTINNTGFMDEFPYYCILFYGI